MIACFKTVLHTVLVPGLLLFLTIQPLPAAAASGDPDIVYVRVPRSVNNIDIGDKQQAGSLFDTLPEVHYIKGNFNAPGQLVLRRSNGEETIIYDCVNNNPEHSGPPVQGKDVCVPMDPSVSYDGRYLAFSVYHGWYDKRQRLKLVPQASGEVGKLRASYNAYSSWAGIFVYDFETGDLHAWPHQNHVWDTAPVWLPGNKIMFSSTRADANTWAKWTIGSVGKPQQLWIADVDANGSNPRNFRNVDPHDQQNALHPFVHSAGRVFYSSRQTNKVRLEVSSVGGDRLTENNQWWLMSTDLRGGDLNAHLHAQLFKWQTFSLTALHFFGERTDGSLCSDEYYRRNNFGAGKIICWPALAANEDENDDRIPLGHEGPYPFKRTQGFYVAVYGDAGDTGGLAQVDGKYVYVPRVHARDPAGLPGNQLLFAAGMGEHSNCHWTIESRNFNCDMGIYRSIRIPVRQGPDHGYGADDTVEIVNDPEWHEFMPKPVMPYPDIYNQEEPAPLTPPDNTNTGISIFASTNAFIGDLKAYPSNKTTAEGKPLPGKNDEWAGPSSLRWCAQQGCAMQALVRHQGPYQYPYPYGNLEGEIKAIRFWKAIPNTIRHNNGNKLYNIWGQKLELIGDVKLEDDGSFKANLPPDTPFLMAGVDKDGRAVARHQQLMSLRPGERQVCSGCHLHDRTRGENKEQPAFIDSDAAKKKAVVPTLDAGEMGVLEWKADVYTMLKNKCGSCHGGSAGNNAPILTASAEKVYHTLLNNMVPLSGGLRTKPGRDGGGGYTVELPWMTRYVNVFFARESLLYWKAAGERTDGRSDPTRKDDFDFGPAHPRPANFTDADLTRLADWIEAGAYMDQHADVDIIFQDGFGP